MTIYEVRIEVDKEMALFFEEDLLASSALEIASAHRGESSICMAPHIA